MLFRCSPLWVPVGILLSCMGCQGNEVMIIAGDLGHSTPLAMERQSVSNPESPPGIPLLPPPEVAMLQSTEVNTCDTPLILHPVPEEAKVSSSIGAIAGTSSVSDSGAFVYEVPLGFTQSRGGITPDLSISYNSSSGESTMGPGWNISISSAIRRCSHDSVHDEGPSPVQFEDEKSRFCLGSKRLIRGPGKNGPLLDDEVLKIEGDLFTNVYVSRPNPRDEIVSFMIKDQHGVKTLFSYAIGGFGENEDKTFLWAQTERWRPDGYGMRWHYTQEGVPQNLQMPLGRRQDGGDFVFDEGLNRFVENEEVIEASPVVYRPTQIEYGLWRNRQGQIQVMADRRVMFQWAPMEDVLWAYESGVPIATTHRLVGISGFFENQELPNLRYRLSYDFEGKLSSIQGCGMSEEEGEVCFEPTTFDWNRSTPNQEDLQSLSLRRVDSGVSLGEVRFRRLNHGELGRCMAGDRNVWWLDLDGDGDDDALSPNPTTSFLELHENQGQGRLSEARVFEFELSRHYTGDTALGTCRFFEEDGNAFHQVDPYPVGVVDIDLDGDEELLLVQESNADLLENQVVAIDLNAQGQLRLRPLGSRGSVLDSGLQPFDFRGDGSLVLALPVWEIIQGVEGAFGGGNDAKQMGPGSRPRFESVERAGSRDRSVVLMGEERNISIYERDFAFRAVVNQPGSGALISQRRRLRAINLLNIHLGDDVENFFGETEMLEIEDYENLDFRTWQPRFGDLNGDGVVDIVSVSDETEAGYILSYQSDHRLSVQEVQEEKFGVYRDEETDRLITLWAVQGVDFNGDGKSEIWQPQWEIQQDHANPNLAFGGQQFEEQLRVGFYGFRWNQGDALFSMGGNIARIPLWGLHAESREVQDELVQESFKDIRAATLAWNHGRQGVLVPQTNAQGMGEWLWIKPFNNRYTTVATGIPYFGLPEHPDGVRQARHFQLIDADGDHQRDDIVTTHENGGNLFIYLNEDKLPRLNGVRTPMGAELRVSYSHLHDHHENRTQIYLQPNRGEINETTRNDVDAKPILENHNLTVVAEITSVHPAGNRVKRYQYRGGWSSKKRGSFLGFNETRSFDVATKTLEVHHRERLLEGYIPNIAAFLGAALVTESAIFKSEGLVDENAQLVSKTYLQGPLQTQSAYGDKIVSLLPLKQINEVYNIDAEEETCMSRTHSSTTLNEWGHPTQVTKHVFNAQSNRLLLEVQTHHHYQGTEQWPARQEHIRSGLPTRVTIDKISHFEDGSLEQLSETQTIQYNEAGLPIVVKIDPDLGAPFSRTTRYLRDERGRIHEIQSIVPRESMIVEDVQDQILNEEQPEVEELEQIIESKTLAYDDYDNIGCETMVGDGTLRPWVTTHTFDTVRSLHLATSGPNKEITQKSFDAFGREIWLREPNGKETRAEIALADPERRARGIVQTERMYTRIEGGQWAHVKSIHTDVVGNAVEEMTSAALPGHFLVTKHTFDNLNRLVITKGPYDPTLLQEEQAPTARYYFDQYGRPLIENHADGSNTYHGYEGQVSWQWGPGNVMETEEAAEIILRNRNNDFQNQQLVDMLAEVLRPGSEEQEINVLGQVVRRTRPEGQAGRPESIYQYNLHGKLSRVWINGTLQVQVGYDRLGRRTSLWDADLGESRYRFDARDKTLWQQDALGNESSFEYDGHGRLVRKVTVPAQGMFANQPRVTLHRYDDYPMDNPIGQQSSLHYSLGKATQSISPEGRVSKNIYNQAGQVIERHQVVDGQTWISRSHFRGDLIIQQDYPRPKEQISVSAFYQYDSAGRLLRTEASFSNEAGLPQRQEIWRPIDINGVGNLTRVRFGNAMVQQTEYDHNNGRLLSIRSGQQDAHGVWQGSLLQDLHYAYDWKGNLLSRENRQTGSFEVFEYDTLDQLVHNLTFVDGQETELDFRYDINGNMTYKGDLGHLVYGEPQRNHGEPNHPHALREVLDEQGQSLETFRYDAQGNMTQSGNKRWSYNAMGKIEAAWVLPELNEASLDAKQPRVRIGLGQPIGMQHQWSYDAEGNRTRKQKSYGTFEARAPVASPAADREVIETIDYFGSAFQMRTTPTARTYRFYLSVPNMGEVLQISYGESEDGNIDSVSQKYFLRDRLGSVEVIVDSQSQPLARQSFDAWGKRRAPDWDPISQFEVSTEIDRGYTGHEMLDDLGVIHMNARLYDPRMGRFLTADPIVPDSKDAMAFNRYAYVHNNPLRFVDPSGHRRAPPRGRSSARGARGNRSANYDAILEVSPGGLITVRQEHIARRITRAAIRREGPFRINSLGRNASISRPRSRQEKEIQQGLRKGGLGSTSSQVFNKLSKKMMGELCLAAINPPSYTPDVFQHQAGARSSAKSDLTNPVHVIILESGNNANSLALETVMSALNSEGMNHVTYTLVQDDPIQSGALGTYGHLPDVGVTFTSEAANLKGDMVFVIPGSGEQSLAAVANRVQVAPLATAQGGVTYVVSQYSPAAIEQAMTSSNVNPNDSGTPMTRLRQSAFQGFADVQRISAHVGVQSTAQGHNAAFLAERVPGFLALQARQAMEGNAQLPQTTLIMQRDFE